jgi:prepilin-type N-terminal cleavage/methylation domain-containing protein
MQWAKQKQGFTIVELLIVIVVIAILAAITIVAYNGIQNRARASAAQSAAKQAFTKVQTFAVQNADQFPQDAVAAGLNNDGSVTYQYRVTNDTSPRYFCVTATTQNTSAYISSNSSTPVMGVCPGHASSGGTVITNLTSNPSSDIEALPPHGSSLVSRSTAEYRSAPAATCMTKSASASYISLVRPGDLAPIEGAEYRTRVWVKSTVSNILFARRSPGASSTFGTAARTVTPNVWTQVDVSLTVAAGTTSFTTQVGWESGSTAEGAVLCVDDVMVTSGSGLYQYADGNTNGWAWNGTPGLSSSVGPPL